MYLYYTPIVPYIYIPICKLNSYFAIIITYYVNIGTFNTELNIK